jgi:predicted nucleic acid-binding protein
MIVLDTNVLSEPMRPSPDMAVVSWLDDQAVETLYVTTITLAEMRFGIAVLPKGDRRDRLSRRFEEEVVSAFRNRILPFDEPASVEYARLRASARADGAAVGTTDAYIAAITAAHDFAVATPDTAPFLAVGVRVIDPFAASYELSYSRVGWSNAAHHHVPHR